jgi:hypothetical protein
LRGRLPGWWRAGEEFYFVLDDGRAFATAFKPRKSTDKLAHGIWSGFYFETDKQVVFIWRKPRGAVQVERWTAPTTTVEAALNVDGPPLSLTRVF